MKGDEWSSLGKSLIFHFRQPKMIPFKVPRYKPTVSPLSLSLLPSGGEHNNSSPTSTVGGVPLSAHLYGWFMRPVWELLTFTLQMAICLKTILYI